MRQRGRLDKEKKGDERIVLRTWYICYKRGEVRHHFFATTERNDEVGVWTGKKASTGALRCCPCLGLRLGPSQTNQESVCIY